MTPPPLLVAVSVPPLVGELAVVLTAAAAISYLCTRIGLVPLVGFVLAGAAVGPYALGVVSDVEASAWSSAPTGCGRSAGCSSAAAPCRWA